MNNLLGSIFTESLTLGQFMLAMITAIVLGMIVAFAFMCKSNHSNSFVTALVLIPAVETIVIMMVNDNLGVGLSVAGSFALIRFRSIKGTAKELTAVFISMTIGIICGTGYIAIAFIFTLLVCGMMAILSLIDFGKESEQKRYLKITMPESTDYDKAFDDILRRYTTSYELETIKTLTLGSLFRIEYEVTLKDTKKMKKMIDELRTRNGNLEIVLSKIPSDREEL